MGSSSVSFERNGARPLSVNDFKGVLVLQCMSKSPVKAMSTPVAMAAESERDGEV
jgi:hypothetical protein